MDQFLKSGAPTVARVSLWVTVAAIVTVGGGHALAQNDADAPAKPAELKIIGGITVVDSKLPELPEALTSFGGAMLGQHLYVYGGHTGSAHAYSIDEQSGRFHRLHVEDAKSWEELPAGPKLQGLALVAHQDAIYRVGGFTAKNREGEEQDLHSQDSFAKFDTRTGKWSDLRPLPEPRSSLDAAILGEQLFVLGGSALRGEDETTWHPTAWSINVSDDSAKWEPLTKPPFQRRAIAVAAHDGKIYVLGGMRPKDGPTTRVDVYDPQSKTWSIGPSLQGDTMAGFGCSAFATGGRLYVSTIRGDVQRLSQDGENWEVLGKIEPPRFFHRMLPTPSGSMLLVGGANMSVGKFTDIQRIDID